MAIEHPKPYRVPYNIEMIKKHICSQIKKCDNCSISFESVCGDESIIKVSSTYMGLEIIYNLGLSFFGLKFKSEITEMISSKYVK